MKRTLATLISVVTMFSLATPAFAQTGAANRTRWNQPRLSLRGVKSAALAAYQHRSNLAFRRARYKELVSRIMNTMPSQLAVTGASGQTDFSSFSRPSVRSIEGWTPASSGR